MTKTDDKTRYKARLANMQNAVEADLVARGITDEELAALDQETEAKAGQIVRTIITARLTDGRSFVYRQENADNAPLSVEARRS